MQDISWFLLTILAAIVHEPVGGQVQVAEECRYSTDSIPRPSWVANPPMSVNETSISGYSCMGPGSISFRQRRERPNSVQLALQEAESTNFPWQYKTVLTYNCERECDDLWYSNFSNYLIGSATFTNLKPNTLYTMVTFLCNQFINNERACTIDQAINQSPKVNISTRPLVPEFSVTRGTTSLNIRFKTNYHVAGPPPQGHEIAVWPVPLTLNTATGPFSHYFELSVQEAVVKNLQPGTGYRLVVRSVASSDGAGSANNYGRWTVQAVRSLPVEPGTPTATAAISRDTAVIIKLTPSQSYDLIKQCLVSVLPTTGSDARRATETVVNVSSNVLFIDGLLPGTEYSYRVAAMNEAGRSNFTEWARFTTTAIVQSVVTEVSITLLWTTPHSLNEEGIASYVVSLSPIQDTADVVTYSLPGSRHTALLGGLQSGVTYQVTLMTGTPSGLQPFYSANVTTMLGGVSESVKGGIGGAGVMLVIVLVVCGVTVLVCFIVWKMMKRRNSATNESCTQIEGHMTNGNENDIKMDSNPAYGGIEYTEGEDVCEVRYHTQGEAGHTGSGRGEGLGNGRRERGGGNGETTEGQVYEEMEEGRSQCPYENVAM